MTGGMVVFQLRHLQALHHDWDAGDPKSIFMWLNTVGVIRLDIYLPKSQHARTFPLWSPRLLLHTIFEGQCTPITQGRLGHFLILRGRLHVARLRRKAARIFATPLKRQRFWMILVNKPHVEHMIITWKVKTGFKHAWNHNIIDVWTNTLFFYDVYEQSRSPCCSNRFDAFSICHIQTNRSTVHWYAPYAQTLATEIVSTWIPSGKLT